MGGEDPLEKGMATHSSILVQKIPWTEVINHREPVLWPLRDNLCRKHQCCVPSPQLPWAMLQKAGTCNLPQRLAFGLLELPHFQRARAESAQEIIPSQGNLQLTYWCIGDKSSFAASTQGQPDTQFMVQSSVLDQKEAGTSSDIAALADSFPSFTLFPPFAYHFPQGEFLG